MIEVWLAVRVPASGVYIVPSYRGMVVLSGR